MYFLFAFLFCSSIVYNAEPAVIVVCQESVYDVPSKSEKGLAKYRL
jgi:hypothetical protein